MRKILFCLFACCYAATGMANNISVSNVTLSNQNVSLHTTEIHNSIMWENSWRTTNNENNYDGAWLSYRYRNNNTGAWLPCTLKTTGFLAATGATIVIPTDKRGAFIHRSATNTGIGSVNFSNNMVLWDYGADGVADNATVEVRAFAVEMVYIPAGAYWLGSNGPEANAFKAGATSNAFQVTSAGALTGLNFNGVGTGTSVPASFPNGFDAFWVMKYECSQQQFADFLNTLTELQANNLNTSPNNITGEYPHFEPLFADRMYSDFAKNTAAKKLTSFAEWMGLRPLSEMEFEKTCRGVGIPPVTNEFAWGDDDILPLTAVSDVGMPNESVSLPLLANAYISEIVGSTGVRVGLFARPLNSSRHLSGAAYYGVMNLSDNGYEMVVNAGTDEGRAVNRSVHGSGMLNADGYTDKAAWQNLNAFMRRGTSYRCGANSFQSTEFARVANRFYIPAITTPVADAIRLARTAP